MKKLTTILAAATLAATAAAGAEAAPAPTGSWSGKLQQDLSALDEPYETSFGVQAYKGRIVTISVEVRMECGESAIWDAKRFKSYRVGRGPKLRSGGGFFLRLKPEGALGDRGGEIRVSGVLGRARGEGTAAAQGPDCSGKGNWTAKRRRT